MINPQGEVIYRRAKATSDGFEGGTLGTTNPHDLWDEWIQKKGDGRIMDAIYPVAKPPTSATSATSSATKVPTRKSPAAWQ